MTNSEPPPAERRGSANPQTDPIATAFRAYAIGKLQDNLANIDRCTPLLTYEQLWHRPNENCHSVANLLLHLAGNIRQWILQGLGDDRFVRDRPAEFAARSGFTVDQMLGDLTTVITRACDIIHDLPQSALAAEHEIQHRQVTGIAAVFHVVEHLSLHTGQIVLQTKVLTGRDLSLYDPEGRRVDAPPGTV